MPDQLSYDFPSWLVRQRTWPGGKRLGKRPRGRAASSATPSWLGHDWRNGPRQPISGAEIIKSSSERLKAKQQEIARNAAMLALTRNPARDEAQNPYAAPPVAPHLTVFGAFANEAERWKTNKGDTKPERNYYTERVSNPLVEGNLPLNDYRYWVGVPWALSLRSVCRACGFAAFSHEERLAHRDGPSKCAVLLTRVYNKLRADKQRQCVICEEQPCSSLMYGVPIHPQCRRAWMWKEPSGISVLSFEIKAMQREIAREDAQYKEKQKEWEARRAQAQAQVSPTVNGA